MEILLVLFGNANSLGGKEAKQYVTNDRFAVISDSIKEDGSRDSLTKTVNSPTGFNNSNPNKIKQKLNNK